MELFTLIKTIRKTSGRKSIAEAASAIGVTPDSLYRWERPGCRPEPALLRALLQHYGASEEVVMGAMYLRSFPDYAGKTWSPPDESEAEESGPSPDLGLPEAIEVLAAAAEAGDMEAAADAASLARVLARLVRRRGEQG